MNILELVKQAKQTNPKLKGLPPPKAALLLRTVFQQIKQELAQKEKGPMPVPGLGVFRVTQVEKEENGQKVTKRRVNFQVGQPKAKKDAQTP